MDNVYTEASDVYSFGVTAWEVISRGALPYGKEGNARVMAILMDPNVPTRQYLTKPSHVSSILYNDVVAGCWHKLRRARPTFATLLSKLNKRRVARGPAPASPSSTATGFRAGASLHSHGSGDSGGAGTSSTPRATSDSPTGPSLNTGSSASSTSTHTSAASTDASSSGSGSAVARKGQGARTPSRRTHAGVQSSSRSSSDAPLLSFAARTGSPLWRDELGQTGLLHPRGRGYLAPNHVLRPRQAVPARAPEPARAPAQASSQAHAQAQAHAEHGVGGGFPVLRPAYLNPRQVPQLAQGSAQAWQHGGADVLQDSGGDGATAGADLFGNTGL